MCYSYVGFLYFLTLPVAAAFVSTLGSLGEIHSVLSNETLFASDSPILHQSMVQTFRRRERGDFDHTALQEEGLIFLKFCYSKVRNSAFTATDSLSLVTHFVDFLARDEKSRKNMDAILSEVSMREGTGRKIL